MASRLRPLAYRAGGDVPGHVLGHVGPEVLPADQLDGLRLAEVSCEDIIVVHAHNLRPERVVLWYEYGITLKKDVIAERIPFECAAVALRSLIQFLR